MGGKKNILVLGGVAVFALLLIGLLVFVFMQSWVAGLVLLGGLLVVLFILLVFVAILAAAKKKKEQAFEDELSASAAGSGGVSGAAAKARVDELRGKFQQGVETFRKHGKSPYSVPWYVIVGEPGAGKTEAIRHSMIGFPPGLQDELQGSGGTLNMDWWFSNHAVILDTAGRMLFEEAGGKASQEWREFLKLLTKARPNCPLNGVMLCIPADSLIKDSIDEVDTKAANIASKLSLIQRELDVRFPVFVVITKADLINGFREFFDSVDDPQLQHQMVGWSNPAPLDEPFRADEVEDHLLDMQDRLVKRRMGLMYDPAPREGGARVDEVDAMYAFPEAMVNLAPNMERYLETIFKGGEWAQQPLFLRGIYFASAMQEGSALDADLAKSLGVPVENLEGGMWERQRSYFLRDLFIEKMFRERGLVTRASNAMKQKAKRRLVLRVFVAAAALVLMVLTWFGYQSLRSSIGDQKAFWASAAERFGLETDSSNYPVLVGGYNDLREDTQLEYLGGEEVGRMQGADSRAEAPLAAIAKADERIRVSAIFKPASLILPDSTSGNLYPGKREQAARVMFTRGVLEPVAGRALRTLDETDRFGNAEVEALAQLIRIYRSTEETPPDTDWTKLGAYVLRDEGSNLSERADPDESTYEAGFGLEAYNADAESIQEAFDKLVDLRDNDMWPRDALEAVAGRDIGRALREITRDFSQKVTSSLQQGGGDDPLAEVKSYLDALEAYDRIELSMLDRYAPVGGGASQQRLPDLWEDTLPRLEEQLAVIDELARRMDESRFDDWYAEQVAAAAAGEMAKLEVLREALGPADADYLAAKALHEADANLPEPDRDDLQRMRDEIDGAVGRLASLQESLVGDRVRLAELHSLMMQRVEGREERVYRDRYRIYQDTEAVRQSGVSLNSFVDLIVTRGEINRGVEQQKQRNQDAAVGDVDARISRAARTSNAVLDMAMGTRTNQLYATALELPDLPDNKPALKAAVERAAERLGYESLETPRLPLMTVLSERLDPGFHPDAARTTLEVLGVVEDRAKAAGGAKGPRIEEARRSYAGDYVEYWRELFSGPNAVARIEEFSDWSAFHQAISAGVRANEIADELTEFIDERIEALAQLPLDSGGLDWGPRLSDDRAEAMEELGDMQDRLERGVGDDCLQEWRGLSADPSRAKRELLRTDQSRFQDQFVGAVGGRNDVSVDYWAEFARRGVQALSKASGDRAELARQRLLDPQQWRRFPITSAWGAPMGGVPSTLTEDQVRQAKRDMDEVGEAAQSAGGGLDGGYAANQVGDSGFTIPGESDINRWLTSMRGERVGEAAALHLGRARLMLDALAGPAQQVKIEWLNDTGFGASSIQLFQGGQSVSKSGNQFEDVDLGAARMPGPPLEIKVWATEQPSYEAAPAGQRDLVSIGGPWSGMTLISALNMTTTDNGKTWTGPITLRGINGRIRVTFARPLPPKDQWPTQ